MSDILEVFKETKVISFLPVLAYFIKLFIENINIRSVEKILMTNSKKFFIQLSNVTLLTVFFALIIGILTIFSEKTSIGNAKELGIFIIVCLGFTCIIVLPLYVITFSLLNIVSFKTNFYIFLESNKKWYISRRLNKDTLLICDEDNNYKFLKQSIGDFTLYSVLKAKSDNTIRWFTKISTKKIKWFSLVIIVVAYVTLFLVNIENSIKIIFFLVICILIILVTLIMVIDINMKSLVGASSSLVTKQKEED